MEKRTDVDRSPIVCATRGGGGSRTVRRRAIQLAVEEDRPLVFLYVVDISFAEDMGPGLGDTGAPAALYAELKWVGRALLSIAQQQALRVGVNAEIAIREGAVREQIAQYVSEAGAARLLLGAPRGRTALVADEDGVELLAQGIREATGVLVDVVRPPPAR